MSEGPLEFLDTSIGYGARTVVRGVSFTITPGEFVGLVGPNGAGKSTLLRAITGGATVSSGDVVWGDVSLARMPERERARIVGVVPQTQFAAFSFTARAYVEMGRHAHLGRLASPGEIDAAIVDEVMARTDTARLADQPVDELSGGDLQRLTLAQALAQQPRILLLDEPTSHLDLNHAL
ncbi:MAG: ABC transporter ATP-binding protein, partial [Coriobacteriia bacterium]|nr:ABC transporter ATP-binding protein [Coriobacteriia bacterium]